MWLSNKMAIQQSKCPLVILGLDDDTFGLFGIYNKKAFV